MNELSLASVLSHPLGQFVVTVIVAAVTSVLTVRMMAAPGDNREAPPRTAAATPPIVAAVVPAPREVPAVTPAPRAIPAVIPVPRDDGAIVAAISAAVYAVIGAHRIVFIADTRTGSSWTNELRSQHHTSHAPHAHASHH